MFMCDLASVALQAMEGDAESITRPPKIHVLCICRWMRLLNKMACTCSVAPLHVPIWLFKALINVRPLSVMQGG